ncbi:hypothetical protein GYMLUDRAFT_730216 [Collybiopsis luxurians FD-317 M1]|nr:hypothetical protein GYMLUDRAFT_730216 [Collybiopsis luxurians FD-317 M1]
MPPIMPPSRTFDKLLHLSSRSRIELAPNAPTCRLLIYLNRYETPGGAAVSRAPGARTWLTLFTNPSQ